ncbi:hypothetical protein CHUAL_011881 [Chamberlinius hualienensis]
MASKMSENVFSDFSFIKEDSENDYARYLGVKNSYFNGKDDKGQSSVVNAKENGQLSLRERAPLSQLQINSTFSQKIRNEPNDGRAVSLKSIPPPPKASFTVFYEDDDEYDDENVPFEIVDSLEKILADDVEPTLTSDDEEPSVTESPMLVEHESFTTEPPRTLKTTIREDLLVGTYSSEIYQYLRVMEQLNRPNPNYLDRQQDVTEGMRSILIDWLVEVSEEYRLQTETLYLSVSYIDRFLSKMSVVRHKLQLVGTSCLLIAAKFEEIYPPETDEFVFITDNTYNQSQVLRMEKVILKVLEFGLSGPTPFWFLQKFSYFLDIEERCFHLAMYLCELSLLETSPFLNYLPSIVAAAALCLALHTFRTDSWPKKMTEFTGYSMNDFQSCMGALLKSYSNAVDHPQQAIRSKYRQDKFSCVANIVPPLILPI